MYADFKLLRRKWRKDKIRVSFWDKAEMKRRGHVDLAPEQFEAIWGIVTGFYDDKRKRKENE